MQNPEKPPILKTIKKPIKGRGRDISIPRKYHLINRFSGF
jgi:hypothetical protein